MKKWMSTIIALVAIVGVAFGLHQSLKLKRDTAKYTYSDVPTLFIHGKENVNGACYEGWSSEIVGPLG